MQAAMLVQPYDLLLLVKLRAAVVTYVVLLLVETHPAVAVVTYAVLLLVTTYAVPPSCVELRVEVVTRSHLAPLVAFA